MVKLVDYAGSQPAWCPGCGNFGILSALKKAFVELELAPDVVLLVSGIGQAGKLPHYTRGQRAERAARAGPAGGRRGQARQP